MQLEIMTSLEAKKDVENPATVSSDPLKKKAVDWRMFIHSDSDILRGKPVVKGTRLSVDFILGLFANGWTFKEISESYPRLSPEAIQAVFAYASECLSEESLFFFPQGNKIPCQ
jgi:uncharacterized protein (DUF433 family)